MTPLVELLGESSAIQAVRTTVARLLARGVPGRRLPAILIEGETGTGKGLLARALHRAGPRAAGPLVEVNCAAIPETLLEAELFGFERGAFTDARQPKAGLFQTAHGGTLFLDEVGLLPERVQAKFLKVLEDRAVRRLGSTHSEPADVAIIAATSENLLDAVQGRRYREDLYHRLAVVTVRLPLARRARVGHPASGGALPHPGLHGVWPATEDTRRGCAGGAPGVSLAGQRPGAGECDGAHGPAHGGVTRDR